MKDNKLIAEFMGIVFPKLDNVIVIDNVVTKEDELQYHTSWDWLMPVVDRIEQVNQGVPQQMLHLSLYSTIDEVYNAVVEFINQLNK